MKLVSNWQAAPKWLSMQLIALATIWESLPADAVAVIPDPWRGYVTLALLIGAGIGRMIDQGTAKP
jgi:hypothetical protein